MSSLRPAILRSQIAAIRKKIPTARVLALKSRFRWEGEPALSVGDDQYCVRQCDSELAIRQAILEAEDAGNPLVVVTGMQDNHLGGDVLARLARRKLLRIDVWDSLLDLFQAHIRDPRSSKYAWVADALLENPPPEGYRPAANGVLTVEHMWGEFLRWNLKFPAAQPDPHDIMLWSLDSGATAKYMRLAAEKRDDIEHWISNRAGALGVFLLRIVSGGKAAMIVPCGLACELIVSDEAHGAPDLRDASIRLEKHTVDQAIRRDLGRLWARAAVELVNELEAKGQSAEVDRIREALDRLIAEVGAQNFAWLSHVAPAGFEQRMERFGSALSEHLSGADGKDLRHLWGLADQASLHRSALSVPQRIERLYMACRLCGWIGKMAAGQEQDGDFAALAQEYFEGGGFADWARNVLYGGEGSEVVSKAYAKLLKRVDEVCQARNQRFALKLANWMSSGAPANGAIRIEDILGRVVGEVARRSPVLLIVCDGMSMAVYRQLIEDIVLRNKWTEYGPEGQPWPLPVVATLPTITEVSRCSLLCGRLTTSQTDDESEGFRTNPALAEVSGNQAPLLFAKSELMEGGGAELARELSAELRSPRRRVIGTVVNAVDDYLLKGEQVAFPWTVSHIPVLEKLLFAAREANRLVVLASDHGHVLERHSKARIHEPGERYRTDGKPVQADELSVEGTRVLAGNGRIVAPWDEHVRYGVKKTGYHGGLSLQEVIVPVSVLGFQQDVEGWVQLPFVCPDWWTAKGQIAGVSAEPIAPEESPASATTEGLPLFAPAQPSGAKPEGNWIDKLIASDVMGEQRALAGRAMLTDERIRTFLTALDVHGGTILVPALAQRMSQPLLRIRGIITVMQRILNVEGYNVLSYDAASESVTLNYDLLKKQFELS